MLIAVSKYNFDAALDCLLVFDTDTISVRKIPYTELFEMQKYKNFTVHNTYAYNTFWVVSDKDFLNVLQNYNCSIPIGYADNTLYTQGRKPVIIRNRVSGLSVNNVVCVKHRNCQICYCFLYKDYLVLRGVWENSRNSGYFTVFVSKGGVVDYYMSTGIMFESIDISLARNKSIAVQLEMLTGGI